MYSRDKNLVLYRIILDKKLGNNCPVFQGSRSPVHYILSLLRATPLPLEHNANIYITKQCSARREGSGFNLLWCISGYPHRIFTGYKSLCQMTVLEAHYAEAEPVAVSPCVHTAGEALGKASQCATSGQKLSTRTETAFSTSVGHLVACSRIPSLDAM